jgi:hypothetical protein
MVYENPSTKSDLLPILLGVSAVTAIIFGGMIVSYNATNHENADMSSLQQQVTESQNSLSPGTSSPAKSAAPTASGTSSASEPSSALLQKSAPLAQNKSARHRV